jgi:hypothetical protein
MDMRFGMWNIQSLYRVGLLIIVANEITELDFVAIQEVRWDGWHRTNSDYAFSYGKQNES